LCFHVASCRLAQRAKRAELSGLQHYTTPIDHLPGYFPFLSLDEQFDPVGQPVICSVLFGLGALTFAHRSLLLGSPKNVTKVIAGLDRGLDFSENLPCV
jgi:hypothetical protein